MCQNIALQAQFLERVTASEEDRLAKPAVWCGHKGQRPKTVNDNRRGWSLEDISNGTYVCFISPEGSEYFERPGYEVARVHRLDVGEELTDGTEIFVVFQQFDP